ncbi:MAG: HAD family phosphatase [Candidatus Latescibacterota bacterium]|nr:MAG: HAD family phosphatase [Candidatus Latescibacterota bacterium]
MNERRPYDLICFDVDGTLVRHPSGMVIWEILNLKYGGSNEINRLRYQMYCEGRLSYERWVQLDVQTWIDRGATRDEVVSSIQEFSLFEGARETVHELKNRGYRLGVISGTIDIVLDTLFPDHPFDTVYTNKIFFDEEGKLEAWRATRFDSHGKPVALREIAQKNDIPLSRTAYVGDGENDIPLLGVAGYFVAFRPRSRELAEGADLVIADEDLPKLLEIFE